MRMNYFNKARFFGCKNNILGKWRKKLGWRNSFMSKESKVERIMEKLKHSKYYMTSDLHIVRYLEEEGIKPYNIGEHYQHKGIRIYFYGNSSMLRACIYHYYGM